MSPAVTTTLRPPTDEELFTDVMTPVGRRHEVMPADLQTIVDNFLARCARERVSPRPYAALRREAMIEVLNDFDEHVRLALRFLTPAQAGATWDAAWQLRKDVIEAIDRCEAAERDAKWTHGD